MLHLNSLSTIHKISHGPVLSVSLQHTTFPIPFLIPAQSIDTDDLNNSSASSVSNQEPSMNDRFQGITEVRKSHPKNIIGGYLNINSLLYKIDSIRDILNRNYLHLLCIAETKLNGLFPDASFKEDNYRPYHKDHRDTSGGLFAYLRSEIPIQRQNEWRQIN